MRYIVPAAFAFLFYIFCIKPYFIEIDGYLDGSLELKSGAFYCTYVALDGYWFTKMSKGPCPDFAKSTIGDAKR